MTNPILWLREFRDTMLSLKAQVAEERSAIDRLEASEALMARRVERAEGQIRVLVERVDGISSTKDALLKSVSRLEEGAGDTAPSPQ